MNCSIKYIIALLGLFVYNSLYSQNENRDVRVGNKYYRANDYDAALKNYRNAESKNSSSFYANYNLGNALYRKDDYLTARTYYQKALSNANNKKEKADALHNIGTTFLKEQKYKESVDALQKSLMENPDSEQTRRQLSYAQRMLKKQNNQQRPNSGDKKQEDNDMSKENANKILNSLNEDEQKMKPSGDNKRLEKNW